MIVLLVFAYLFKLNISEYFISSKFRFLKPQLMLKLINVLEWRRCVLLWTCKRRYATTIVIPLDLRWRDCCLIRFLLAWLRNGIIEYYIGMWDFIEVAGVRGNSVQNLREFARISHRVMNRDVVTRIFMSQRLLILCCLYGMSENHVVAINA